MGIHLRHLLNFEQMRLLAQKCELLRFDGVWIDDHIFSYDSIHTIPYLDPWLVLSGLASITSRLQLGLLVANIFLQHPSRLLQASLTMHSMSGERFILGLGAGWFSGDFDALGIEKPSFQYRCAYLNESCRFLKENWMNEEICWESQFFRVTMKNYGWKSLLTSSPRLLIGGKHRSIIEIAVRHANELNVELTSETEATKLDQTISSACESLGRSTTSLARSILVTMVITTDKSETQSYRRTFFGEKSEIAEEKIVDNVLVGTAEEIVSCLGNVIDVMKLDGIIVILFGSESITDPLVVLRDEISAAL